MIHPTSIIDTTANLATDVEVGPYAIIGKHVRIGKGTTVGAHAIVGDWTEIGENNRIFPQSSVGAPPQDLKYRGEECWTRIGDNNMIREFTTIHRGTVTGHAETVIGNSNMWSMHNMEKPLGQVFSYMKDMGERAGYKFISSQENR